MPDPSSKKPKRPRDLSLLAKKIVEIATEGESAEEPTDKNPHAVALGRLGGKKGGLQRIGAAFLVFNPEVNDQGVQAEGDRLDPVPNQHG